MNIFVFYIQAVCGEYIKEATKWELMNMTHASSSTTLQLKCLGSPDNYHGLEIS